MRRTEKHQKRFPSPIPPPPPRLLKREGWVLKIVHSPRSHVSRPRAVTPQRRLPPSLPPSPLPIPVLPPASAIGPLPSRSGKEGSRRRRSSVLGVVPLALLGEAVLEGLHEHAVLPRALEAVPVLHAHHACTPHATAPSVRGRHTTSGQAYNPSIPLQRAVSSSHPLLCRYINK